MHQHCVLPLHKMCVQFDHDAEAIGEIVQVSDKAVLLYNQALIHLRVSCAAVCFGNIRFS